MDKISVCILTKNSEKTLEACLKPLLSFDELLVLDTGSEDRTLAILDAYPRIRVFKQDGIQNFGMSRNRLAEKASNDWILMVDSDEVTTSELLEEIRSLPDRADTVYSLPRINHYRNRPIRACGWYPDYCLRLYHRCATRWKDRIVHETLLVPPELRVVRLRGEVNHFSCEGAEQLARKAVWYAELFGTDFAGRRRTSFFEAFFRATWTFIRSYFLRWGVVYGRDGLTISLIAAFGSWMKYVVLQEKNEAIARSINDKSPRHTEID